MVRIIAHLDMDAFFAAIEERDNPRWTGMPIVVGSDPEIGRGVVSTANYKAREYGIKSAISIREAWRASEEARKSGKPAAVFLPVNGRRYGQVSSNIMDVLARYAPVVEQASVDEAYLDLSHLHTYSKAEQACRRMKQEIYEKERLTCSIGLAPNKLVAKVASDFNKPDGLTVVPVRRVQSFLTPLDIRKIPGIGPKSEQELKRRGLATVGQVQTLTETDLYQLMGEWGLDLYEKVRGESADELVTEWTAKSIGEQETFDIDTLDSGYITDRLTGMARSVMRQFKREGFSSYRRVVLTVRFADFKTVTRSHALHDATASPMILKTEMLRLFLPFLDRRENPSRKLIRLAGIRIEEFQEQ